MKLNRFLKECQEKGVFKHLSIYIVSSWVFLQVLSVITDPLNFPKTTITYSVLILLIGFPIYIFFLWKYQIKPSNIEKASQIDYEDISVASSKSSIEIEMEKDGLTATDQFNKNFRKLYFIGLGVVGTIALLVAGLIIKTNIKKDGGVALATSFLTGEVSDKIAILNFDNNTSDKEYDIVGKMAVDWIMHGITENRLAQVISPKIIDDYSNVLKASIVPTANENVVTNYLKPSKIIIGNFYLKSGRLLFQSSITDENMNKTLIAFKPVDCDPNAPLDCIEALKQRILGYLVTEEKPLYKLQESPPNFEAYQNLLKAKGIYGDNDEYLRYINASVVADSTYFEAKVLKLAHYYNLGEYKVSDSLLNILSKESGTNKRQLNLLKMYEALLQGNNRNTYRYLKREYEMNLFDLETNSSIMIVAKQFVNRPEDVALIFNEISMEGMDVMDCVDCTFRIYIKALSDVQIGEIDTALELLVPFAKTKGNKRLKEVLIRAYIKSGKSSETVKNLLSNFSHIVTQGEWRELTLFTGKEYLFREDDELAGIYFNQLIASFQNKANNEKDLQLLADAHFYKKEFERASHYFEKFLALDPARKTESYTNLAISYQKDKKSDMAEAILKKLQETRSEYDYGNVDYALARYYAAISEDKKAIEHLYRAVASGKRYSLDAYQNEVFFKSYVGTKDFDEIMNFWK